MTTARRNFLWLAALLSPLVVSVGWPGMTVVDASASIRSDFNGDGVDDLAVGVIGENNGAGGVNIIYGQPGTGLSPLGNQFFSQANAFVPALPEPGDNCGATLATGDFNGDGFADLALGCPGENTNAGGVIILYGLGGLGLTDAGSQVFSQNTLGIPDTEEPGDRCGAALAAGDLNGDGADDLAVGCFGEDLGSIDGAGAVFILYGAVGSGLTATGSQFFHQATPSLPNTPNGAEAGGLCGRALAAGDFDGDGVADLAIGCPTGDKRLDEHSSSVVTNVGRVRIRRGNVELSEIFSHDFDPLHQDTPGVPDGAEAGDLCGRALAAGDFNGDGVADLAFGCDGDYAWDPIYPKFRPHRTRGYRERRAVPLHRGSSGRSGSRARPRG